MSPTSPRNNKSVLALLSGGDRRSIGRSDAVAAMVLAHPALFRGLIKGMWDQDAVVRMRAADAAEKASLQKPKLLRPFKAELLGLLAETKEQELRWHLAQMVPRLSLTPAERAHAASILRTYLDDRSSIVKTFAMQGLADLAVADDKLLPATIELLDRLTRSGTPAMRARGRKLLARFVRP
ncbi:MAG TPA: hypothetical protein VI488_07025 [Candidatus Angelobacter sp.]